MENLMSLMHGFDLALTANNLLFCLIGVTVGQFVGVLPGLGPVAGTAMLIPLTYALSPTTAVIMLAGAAWTLRPSFQGQRQALNIPLVGFFARLLTIPNYILIPAIAAVSFVGVYAIHSTTFDLILMVGLGILGYILRKLHFPLSALILGYVLGELMESSLRRALSISHGDASILFHGTITQALWALSALMVLLPVYRWLRRRKAA